MTEIRSFETASRSSFLRTLAAYGSVFLSVGLGLLAYLSLRNALHVALVRFDVYMFAWRAIDIGVALAALLGVLILAIADLFLYKKAAANGRLLRTLLLQCGILAGIAVIFLCVQWALV